MEPLALFPPQVVRAQLRGADVEAFLLRLSALSFVGQTWNHDDDSGRPSTAAVVDVSQLVRFYPNLERLYCSEVDLCNVELTLHELKELRVLQLENATLEWRGGWGGGEFCKLFAAIGKNCPPNLRTLAVQLHSDLSAEDVREALRHVPPTVRTLALGGYFHNWFAGMADGLFRSPGNGNIQTLKIMFECSLSRSPSTVRVERITPKQLRGQVKSLLERVCPALEVLELKVRGFTQHKGVL